MTKKPEKIYPVVEIKNPNKMWSPCSGKDCDHPSHNQKTKKEKNDTSEIN